MFVEIKTKNKKKVKSEYTWSILQDILYSWSEEQVSKD